jgi:putative intracellular protease/amidase
MPRLAVRQIAGWPLRSGEVIALSLAAEESSREVDAYIARLLPDWVIELREDFYHERPGMATLGGSVVHDGGVLGTQLAEGMCAGVNRSIPLEANRFRAIEQADVSRVTGVAGMLLVTSARGNTTPTKDERKAPLVRRHRLMVHAFLEGLGMLPEGSHPDRCLTGAAPGTLHFAIYDGEGAGRPLPFITDVQNGVQNSVGYPLSPEEMAAGALEGFDVVLFPGGMASQQFDALGESGREAVVQFVNGGGGYIGICAGAFMAASEPYEWGLNLLDARIVDHDHWARGIGPVELELSEEGRRVFGDFDGRLTLHYGQGPILEPAGRGDIEDYAVLGWYRTGIGLNGADPEVMVDTPAIVCGRYGEGRVLASSGHAEWSSGLESFLLRYFEWAGGRQE